MYITKVKHTISNVLSNILLLLFIFKTWPVACPGLPNLLCGIIVAISLVDSIILALGQMRFGFRLLD